MTRRRARIAWAPLSMMVGWVICAGVLLAQSAAAPTFPPAPAGFDTRVAGIPAGRVEPIEYPSSVGGKRPTMVYTPPGYSAARKYPVLYLLHAIGGNETHWTQFGAADSILDNLVAANKAVPMIVVMPNGRAKNEPSTLFAGRGGRRGDGRGAAPAGDGAAPAPGQGTGTPAAGQPAGGGRGVAAMGVEFQA